ncbi:hypothetical protein BpHYR1_017598, partial [Brachionus plicatilis]
TSRVKLQYRVDAVTLIWNKEIVNSCPYRLFSSLKLNLPYDNILSNPSGNQMFKSNLTLLSESENAVHDLLLADSDSIELKTFTMIDKIKEKICNYKLSTIRAFREHEDRNWIRKIGAKIAIINEINVTIINSVNSFTINSLDSELDKLTFGHDSSINTNIVIYSSDFDTKFLKNINEKNQDS